MVGFLLAHEQFPVPELVDRRGCRTGRIRDTRYQRSSATLASERTTRRPGLGNDGRARLAHETRLDRADRYMPNVSI
jgi:hypothetical protein